MDVVRSYKKLAISTCSKGDDKKTRKQAVFLFDIYQIHQVSSFLLDQAIQFFYFCMRSILFISLNF